MIKKIIVLVVAICVAGYAGYYLGIRHCLNTIIPMRDMYNYAHVGKVMEDSYRAYCEEDPAIAVWALERMIEHLEAQKQDSFRDYWTSPDLIDMDIMLSYGRLAKVTQTSDPDYSSGCLARAVEIGRMRYTNDTITSASIFEIIERLDSKRKANHGLESTGAPPAADAPETHP